MLPYGNVGDVDRFVAKVQVDPDSGCWLWTASCHYREGYGKFGYKGRTVEAHRWAWLAAHGSLPEKPLQFDHLCRVRRCANPEHLEPVTPQVNQLRGETLAAQNAAKTHCKRGHPFTPENTKIHIRHDGRNPFRVCLTCYRAPSRAAV